MSAKNLTVILEETDADCRAVSDYFTTKRTLGRSSVTSPVCSKRVIEIFSNKLKSSSDDKLKRVVPLIILCLDEFVDCKKNEDFWTDVSEDVSCLLLKCLEYLSRNRDEQSIRVLTKYCFLVVKMCHTCKVLSTLTFSKCAEILFKIVFRKDLRPDLMSAALDAINVSCECSDTSVASHTLNRLEIHLRYLAKIVYDLPTEDQTIVYSILRRSLKSVEESQLKALLWFPKYPSLRLAFENGCKKPLSEGSGLFVNELFEIYKVVGGGILSGRTSSIESARGYGRVTSNTSIRRATKEKKRAEESIATTYGGASNGIGKWTSSSDLLCTEDSAMGKKMQENIAEEDQSLKVLYMKNIQNWRQTSQANRRRSLSLKRQPISKCQEKNQSSIDPLPHATASETPKSREPLTQVVQNLVQDHKTTSCHRSALQPQSTGFNTKSTFPSGPSVGDPRRKLELPDVSISASEEPSLKDLYFKNRRYFPQRYRSLYGQTPDANPHLNSNSSDKKKQVHIDKEFTSVDDANRNLCLSAAAKALYLQSLKCNDSSAREVHRKRIEESNHNSVDKLECQIDNSMRIPDDKKKPADSRPTFSTSYIPKGREKDIEKVRNWLENSVNHNSYAADSNLCSAGAERHSPSPALTVGRVSAATKPSYTTTTDPTLHSKNVTSTSPSRRSGYPYSALEVYDKLLLKRKLPIDDTNVTTPENSPQHSPEVIFLDSPHFSTVVKDMVPSTRKKVKLEETDNLCVKHQKSCKLDRPSKERQQYFPHEEEVLKKNTSHFLKLNSSTSSSVFTKLVSTGYDSKTQSKDTEKINSKKKLLATRDRENSSEPSASAIKNVHPEPKQKHKVEESRGINGFVGVKDISQKVRVHQGQTHLPTLHLSKNQCTFGSKLAYPRNENESINFPEPVSNMTSKSAKVGDNVKNQSGSSDIVHAKAITLGNAESCEILKNRCKQPVASCSGGQSIQNKTGPTIAFACWDVSSEDDSLKKVKCSKSKTTGRSRKAPILSAPRRRSLHTSKNYWKLKLQELEKSKKPVGVEADDVYALTEESATDDKSVAAHVKAKAHKWGEAHSAMKTKKSLSPRAQTPAKKNLKSRLDADDNAKDEEISQTNKMFNQVSLHHTRNSPLFLVPCAEMSKSRPLSKTTHTVDSSKKIAAVQNKTVLPNFVTPTPGGTGSSDSTVLSPVSASDINLDIKKAQNVFSPLYESPPSDGKGKDSGIEVTTSSDGLKSPPSANDFTVPENVTLARSRLHNATSVNKEVIEGSLSLKDKFNEIQRLADEINSVVQTCHDNRAAEHQRLRTLDSELNEAMNLLGPKEDQSFRPLFPLPSRAADERFLKSIISSYRNPKDLSSSSKPCHTSS